MYVWSVEKLPRTKTYPLDKAFRSDDPNTAAQLAHASKLREYVQRIIEGGQQRPVTIIAGISEFIPYALSLLLYFEAHPDEKLTDELKVSWTSAVMKSNEFHMFYHPKYDLTMMLMAAAYAEMQFAAESVHNLLPADAQFEEASKLGAHHLKIAAGIFDFVACSDRLHFRNLPSDRPVEILPDLAAALSEVCLAEADKIAVSKGLGRGTSEDLASKLTSGLRERYHSASAKLKSMKADYEDISPWLRNYVDDCIQLYSAMTFRLQASCAYAAKEYGQAVAYCKAAQLAIGPLTQRSIKIATFKAEVIAENATLQKLTQRCVQDNDSIYYQKVPDEKTMQLPPSKRLMVPIVYSLPPPALNIDLLRLH